MTYEIPASTATTAVLTVNGGAGNSSIDTAEDRDWWRVSLNAGTTYIFNMYYNLFNHYYDHLAHLSLLDSTGTTLATGNEILYKPATTGTYYLSAGYSDYNIGGYEVYATIDYIAPTVRNFYPDYGATGISTFSNIVVQFNESIKLGAGNIELRSGSASGALVEAFNVATSNRLSIESGSPAYLRIDPISVLSANTSYYVTFASGSVRDHYGNNYSETSVYNFTTGAADIPASILTTAVLKVNGVAVKGKIDFYGDQDWWQVYLHADTTYSFNSFQGKLFDSTGKEVFGGQPTSTGTYYLSVNSYYGDAGVGDYTISVTKVVDFPYWVDILAYWVDIQGYSATIGSKTHYYYFPESMPEGTFASDTNGWLTLTSLERDVVRQAFKYISSIVDLNFVEATDASHAGTITFAVNQKPDDPTSYGYTYFVDGNGGSSIFYDVDYRAMTFSQSSMLLHEMGHALGLVHPFFDGSNPYATHLTSAEDTLAWSVMSYKGGGRANMAYSPLDIATLQAYYGPSLTSHAGNDTYVLSAATTNIIWDGGGTDSLNGSALTANLNISLLEGYWGYIGAQRPTLISSAGNVTINIGTVIENAEGGSGNDNIVGNEVANILTGNAGNDTLDGYDGNDSLSGNAGNDSLMGDVGNDILNGGVDADQMTGGLGNDTYYVDNIGDVVTESSALLTEIDTVNSAITYSLGINIENLTLVGVAVINGTGNALNNTLTGNAFANMLSGLAGNDILNGGAGLDTLIGGDGSDTYYVDNVGDVVTETNAVASTGGTDLVNSYLSAYTLGTNVENGRILATTAANMIGNALNNIIYAGNGVNSIDGSGGTDTLSYQYSTTAGLAGVNLNLSVLNVAAGQATASGISGADLIKGIENLTGSNYNDTFTGNAGVNVLNGGLGADQLTGGLGNDTYYVDNSGDVVTESSGLPTEIDTVNSSITYSLGANLENLTLIGAAVINGTGNAFNNTLTGNASANILSGLAGNDILNGGAGLDTLIGGDGSDTYYVDNVGDVVTETNALASTGGIDLVNSYLAAYTLGTNVENGRILATTAANMTGNTLNNVIYAGNGVNSIDGLGGTDTLSYQFSTTAGLTGVTLNLAVLNGLGQATASGISGTDLLKGIENLTGSNYNDTFTGNAGVNVLNGGLGADQLTGGLGNDTYYVDNIGDVVTESSALLTEIDTVNSAITYMLGVNVEKLALIGTGIINGTGNALNNTITGNSAANILNGGTGNDSLLGGQGNDILTGGSGNDHFVFNTAINATTNNDTIIDFVSGSDKLDFSKAIFTALGSVGALNSAAFNSGIFITGQDATDRVIYNTNTGGLYYDADGNGAGASVQIALLGVNAPHPGMIYSDILVTT